MSSSGGIAKKRTFIKIPTELQTKVPMNHIQVYVFSILFIQFYILLIDFIFVIIDQKMTFTNKWRKFIKIQLFSLAELQTEVQKPDLNEQSSNDVKTAC